MVGPRIDEFRSDGAEKWPSGRDGVVLLQAPGVGRRGGSGRLTARVVVKSW